MVGRCSWYNNIIIIILLIIMKVYHNQGSFSVFKYHICSNKRRGAYSIFRITQTALIRGLRLFEQIRYVSRALS